MTLPENVVLPPTLKLLSRVATPVTSNVPGKSTLLVHSTSLPLAAVCSTCLAAPSAKLLTANSVVAVVIFASIRASIAFVVATFVSSVVYQVSVLIIVGAPVHQALFAFKACGILPCRKEFLTLVFCNPIAEYCSKYLSIAEHAYFIAFLWIRFNS